jgi:hypothetical protein
MKRASKPATQFAAQLGKQLGKQENPMIPFIEPYTAPDGTTRRPLAERVPECVPKSYGPPGFTLFKQVDVWTNWIFAWKRDEDGLIEECNEVDDTSAAALWRVAVEDWIQAMKWRGNPAPSIRSKEAFKFQVWNTLDPRELAFIHLDKTSALNAAAHAAADAMGIPF